MDNDLIVASSSPVCDDDTAMADESVYTVEGDRTESNESARSSRRDASVPESVAMETEPSRRDDDASAGESVSKDAEDEAQSSQNNVQSNSSVRLTKTVPVEDSPSPIALKPATTSDDKPTDFVIVVSTLQQDPKAEVPVSDARNAKSPSLSASAKVTKDSAIAWVDADKFLADVNTPLKRADVPAVTRRAPPDDVDAADAQNAVLGETTEVPRGGTDSATSSVKVAVSADKSVTQSSTVKPHVVVESASEGKSAGSITVSSPDVENQSEGGVSSVSAPECSAPGIGDSAAKGSTPSSITVDGPVASANDDQRDEVPALPPPAKSAVHVDAPAVCAASSGENTSSQAVEVVDEVKSDSILPTEAPVKIASCEKSVLSSAAKPSSEQFPQNLLQKLAATTPQVPQLSKSPVSSPDFVSMLTSDDARSSPVSSPVSVKSRAPGQVPDDDDGAITSATNGESSKLRTTSSNPPPLSLPPPPSPHVGKQKADCGCGVAVSMERAEEVGGAEMDALSILQFLSTPQKATQRQGTPTLMCALSNCCVRSCSSFAFMVHFLTVCSWWYQQGLTAHGYL